MSENNKPTSIYIIDEGKGNNIFSDRYTIPLYQRAYSWSYEEITRLLDDIEGIRDKNYYIGSLIVSKRESGTFEVIDGQQRLTTLFLLLKCLGERTDYSLSFDCRADAINTLDIINEGVDKYIEKVRGAVGKKLNTLEAGFEMILEYFGNDENSDRKAEFLDKLKRVVLFRIEVPPHTDLNRYFEIMNTRGEQLEQQDIVKANLMGCIKKGSEKHIFATIWDACSDMTGYVQMHFETKDVLENKIREGIFKSQWGDMPSNNWAYYNKNVFSKCDNDENAGALSIGYIIKNLIFSNNKYDGKNENEENVRFESIVDFPHFLIHTFNVYAANKGIDKISLDDSFLKKNFDAYLGTLSEHERECFAKEYILTLLQARFLFDKYIIKREYIGENKDGVWSLKTLHTSGQQSKKKPYYSKTWFIKNTNEKKNEEILMIQAALRVSYTSPKSMDWITRLLVWLMKDNCSNLKQIDLVLREAEAVAKEAVEIYLNEGNLLTGVKTPHVVLNYLDYILWKKQKKNYENFVFEFRNSVEHWYPQQPPASEREPWKDVDRFGNLCLVQRNINSKFSNQSPEAKKDDNKKMIKKGSIKLRKMSEMTSKNGWTKESCETHEKEMIALLKSSCGLNETLKLE